MISFSNYNLWMILLIIKHVSAVSYNQPKFCSDSSWNPNATTFANRSTIGSYPYDIFINTNNTIYVPNQDNGQIVVWFKENSTITRNSSGDLSNPYCLFVTTSDDIYVDTFNSIGGVSKWTSNSTIGILTMHTCQKCWDIFVDISNTLYCSLNGRHQVITKSMNDGITRIAAGTGSPDNTLNTLNNPRGIFVDINFDLYVADYGNDRIQLFNSGRLRATTVAGSGSLNTTITLNCPTGIVLDGDKYLFIVDSGNNRIVRSKSTGFECIAGCSGSSGSASNQLNNPWSLSFDSYGNIFVTDQNNNRIQKYILSTSSCDEITTRKETITSSINNDITSSTSQNVATSISTTSTTTSTTSRTTSTTSRTISITTTNAFTPSTAFCNGTVATPCTTTTTIVASCQSYEVSWNNHCYYLDGSSGTCTTGYSRATNAVLTCINTQFAGKTYRSTISNNCCVWAADTYECYGLTSNCNSAGPFISGPALGGAGCNNAQHNHTQQLTFCGSN